MKIKTILVIAIILFYKVSYANNNQEYNEIIENLRCLVCQNQSLSDTDNLI